MAPSDVQKRQSEALRHGSNYETVESERWTRSRSLSSLPRDAILRSYRIIPAA